MTTHLDVQGRAEETWNSRPEKTWNSRPEMTSVQLPFWNYFSTMTGRLGRTSFQRSLNVQMFAGMLLRAKDIKYTF